MVLQSIGINEPREAQNDERRKRKNRDSIDAVPLE